MKFYPFDAAINTSETDFDLAELGKTLGLSDVQTTLLKHILRRFEILIWYADRPDPHVELCTFMDGYVTASMSLNELLDDIVEPEDHIGDEEEIAALEELRLQIDKAINSRRARLGNGMIDAASKS